MCLLPKPEHGTKRVEYLNVPTDEENLALKVFKAHITAIHKAVIPHIDWLIRKLSSKFNIITSTNVSNDARKLLKSQLLGPSHKAIILLALTEMSINSDYRYLRRFIRVLKRCPSLKSVADALKESYSELFYKQYDYVIIGT